MQPKSEKKVGKIYTDLNFVSKFFQQENSQLLQLDYQKKKGAVS